MFQIYKNVREFSECPRSSLEKFYSEIKHIYITLYTVYRHFSHCIHDFRERSHNSLVGRGFITFVFLWPTTISPRNASRKLVMTQDGKGLFSNNFPLQVIFALLANSWCPERSFQTKTISSGYLGEYKFCYML